MPKQSHTTSRLTPSYSPSNSYFEKTTTPLLLQGTLPQYVQDFVTVEFREVTVCPFLN